MRLSTGFPRRRTAHLARHGQLIIFLGPLALAAWRDRRRAEAQAIQADVGGEIGRAVGRGLFAVRVAPGLLRGGTVYLGGEGLPEDLCRRAAVGWRLRAGTGASPPRARERFWDRL